MEPVHLAFLWHQHQPFYKDDAEGHYVLPWVRLHAVKDYIGMLLVLNEFESIRCTINLVPSLIAQIQEYADGRAEDDPLRITRKAPGDLDEKDRGIVSELFFAANPDRLINVFPRYRELFEKRNDDLRTGGAPCGSFSRRDLLDAQVWATLAWFHPLAAASNDALKTLREKGRDFTEQDKEAMLAAQDEVIGRVLPLHAELARTGRIEISTTPFYHPILPLLCNMESAREAMPDVPMPERRSDFAADAGIHLDRAFELHARVFGTAPTGLWPSEGSVGMDMLPLLKGRGLKWIATDEKILERSAGVNLGRDSSACLTEPDGLYQPYALPGEDLPAVVFRDHALSDAVGFEYHRGDEKAGAENFVWRIEEVARRCKGRPRLVPVILDGENPWDCYTEAGLPFLRALYARLEKSESVVTTRLSDYVAEHPPEGRLDRLAAGSWIDGSFAIWIGHEDDRTAWSLLAEAREAVLAREKKEPSLDPNVLRAAWEQIYIAEGSDWFWWFGPDHTSDQDYLFDRLFRAHLLRAYSLIGESPPPKFLRPIGKNERPPAWSEPTGPLTVTVDGAVTEPNEWAAAGAYRIGGGGAMAHAASGPIDELRYGLARDAVCLRLDAAGGDIAPRLTEDVRVQVRFTAPRTALLVCQGLQGPSPSFRLLGESGRFIDEPLSIAVGSVLELTCLLNRLGVRPNDEIEFYVEVFQAGTPMQRVPQEGALRLRTPAGD